MWLGIATKMWWMFKGVKQIWHQQNVVGEKVLITVANSYE